MTVDRAWIERNIGFDPLVHAAPAASFTHKEAARTKAKLEDTARERIDFDSEGPEGRSFLSFSKATGLSRFTNIPWPPGLAPKADASARKGPGGALPKADVLVVTWTVDEGHALSRVLTPGKDSHDDYVPYKHNYAKFAARMSRGAPAVEAKSLGAYWTATIGGKKVVILKSNSHLSQDTKRLPPAGQNLPNFDFWAQIIHEVGPSLVLTTGTAGGIGAGAEVGDVVVSPIFRFDCQKWLNHPPYAGFHYENQKGVPGNAKFAVAKTLFKANSGQLPSDNTRPPEITTVPARALNEAVLTTDFFGFDTSSDFFHLQGLGTVSEMGDAILGMVAQKMGGSAPSCFAVRNVSDPQIASDHLSIEEQDHLAGHIYKAYGRWSSVCSAIVCWAMIVA